jgi:hypothetical protein
MVCIEHDALVSYDEKMYSECPVCQTIKNLTIENEVLKKSLSDERKARADEASELNQKIGQLKETLNLCILPIRDRFSKNIDVEKLGLNETNK